MLLFDPKNLDLKQKNGLVLLVPGDKKYSNTVAVLFK